MPGQTTASDLLRLALEAYRDEYKDLSESWRNLDTKAQGLVAIAGIFLAAVFAWTREIPATFGCWERLLLAASSLFLVAAVVAAVLALKIRIVSAPPLGEGTAEMVADILKLRPKQAELRQRVEFLYNDQIKLWKKTNADIGAHVLSKANRIAVGQWALLLASILVAGLAMGTVADIF